MQERCSSGLLSLLFDDDDDGDDEMCVTTLSVAIRSTSRACHWKLAVCERRVQGPGRLLWMIPVAPHCGMEVVRLRCLRSFRDPHTWLFK